MIKFEGVPTEECPEFIIGVFMRVAIFTYVCGVVIVTIPFVVLSITVHALFALAVLLLLLMLIAMIASIKKDAYPVMLHEIPNEIIIDGDCMSVECEKFYRSEKLCNVKRVLNTVRGV